MGYLADIVADARERHFGESAPAYSEDVIEVGLAGEVSKPTISAGNPQLEKPSALIEQSPVAVDSAKTQAPDLPPARKQSSDPESAKDTHDASAQQSAQQPLHHYLRQLSQQTLITRSEEILARHQTPDATSTAKTDARPASAEQQKPLPDSHEDTPFPAAKITTVPRVDSPDKSAVPPAQDNRSAPAAERRTIQATLEADSQSAQDTHQRRPLPGDVKLNINRDRQSAPVTSHAPKREQQTSAPPRQPQERTSGAPQLRIGQINVVVESTKPDQDRRRELERESDSGSRYFLRSL